MWKGMQLLLVPALLVLLAGCAAPDGRAGDADDESVEMVCQERPTSTGTRVSRPVCRPAES
jgi:hypothetical protein